MSKQHQGVVQQQGATQQQSGTRQQVSGNQLPNNQQSGGSELISVIPTNNRFDELNNDDGTDDSENETDNTPRTKEQRLNKTKTAPIVVVGSNATAVQSTLWNSVASRKFECILMTTGIRVTVPDPEKHAETLNALKAGKFQ